MIIPFFINVAVNVTLGVLTFHDQAVVTTWKLNNGAVADSVGTCFFLPLLTCLIATPIVRRHVTMGIVKPLPMSELPALMRFLIRPVLLRAGILGACGLVMLIIPVCIVYWLFAGDSIETVRFIAVKSIFAGSLGVIVTPLIALLALGE